MEMHQLRYFAAVARTGSFSRAAVECRVAQPSLSQQILKLEGELAERLLERTPRRALLTPAGELFLPHALAILDAAERGRRDVGEMGGRMRGKVVLGALPTIAPYLLPPLLRALHDAYPEIEVVVHEETTLRLLRGVEEGEIDLALISEAAPGSRVAMETVGQEELLLCLPASHPLARRRVVTADDLRGEPFIMMQEGHCLGAQTQQFCQMKGFRPRVSCRSVQVGTVQAMVRAGLGISLVPQMACREPLGKGIAYRALDGTRPRRPLVLALSRERKPGAAVLEVARRLREACREGAAVPGEAGGRSPRRRR